ncbi:hypothetical protein PG993_009730 [Apiospora rasikravindrae]|uniref:Ankyrin n=1 Tax=Apiospora rasikravindrae TaxID=990691 RepID=A0ABR1SK87_9PEZI
MDFDWNSHFDEIRTLFLIERKPLTQIEALFTRDHKQWVQRLSRWMLKKNLSEKDWKYVSHVLGRRKAKSKDSLVFVSGVHVPPKRLHTGLRNHRFALKRRSYHTSPSPEPPSDVLVSVSTPASHVWARDLPWLQFQFKIHDYLSLRKSITSTHTQPLARSPSDSKNIHLIFPPFIPLPREISWAFRFIHHKLAQHIPEECPDSHNERAYQIIQGQGQGHLQAILEVLVFTLSNNMLSEWTTGHSYYDCDPSVISLLEIYRKIGFSFKDLVTSPDRTLQAVTDRAFASTIRTGRLDLLKELAACGLDLKSRLNRPILDSYRNRRMPIHIAADRQDFKMAGFIRQHSGCTDETSVITIPSRARVNLESPDSVNVIFAQYLAISEYELLNWLNDEECTNSTASVILEKLWRIETTARLEWPDGALLHAIRFNLPKYVEDFLSCGDRLLQNCFPYRSHFDRWTSCRASWHVLPLYEAAVQGDNRTFQLLLNMLSNGLASKELILRTTLRVAAAFGNMFALNLLLETAEDINFEALVDEHVVCINVVNTRALDNAINRRHIDASVRLISAGCKVTEQNAYVATRYPDMFDAIQQASGSSFDITARILVSLIEGKISTFLQSSTLELYLGLKLLVNMMGGCRSLKRLGCLRYNPFALAAAVFVAGRSKDRSMLTYVLGLRAETTTDDAINNDYRKDELGACLIAASFQDIDSLQLLKRCGLFKIRRRKFAASHCNYNVDQYDDRHIRGDPNGQLWVVGILRSARLALHRDGWPFMGLALAIGAEWGTMKVLLQDQPRPSSLDALFALLHRVDPHMILPLLDLIKDINDRGHPRCPTILQAAIRSHAPCVVSRLLELKADVNAPPPNRHSIEFPARDVLQLACEAKDLGLVKRLIEYGARVNSPAARNAGATALQISAIQGYIQIARVLLDHDADLNAPRAKKNGRTAIEGAAEHGRIDMIELLLGKGVHTLGTSGKIQYHRAIQLAMEECHYTAANMLKDCRPWDEEDRILFEGECICDETPDQEVCWYCEIWRGYEDEQDSSGCESEDEISENGSTDGDLAEPAQQSANADYAMVLQPGDASEDQFSFSNHGTEYVLDLAAIEQRHDPVEGLTTDVVTAEQVSPGVSLQRLGGSVDGSGDWLESYFDFAEYEDA